MINIFLIYLIIGIFIAFYELHNITDDIKEKINEDEEMSIIIATNPIILYITIFIIFIATTLLYGGHPFVILYDYIKTKNNPNN